MEDDENIMNDLDSKVDDSHKSPQEQATNEDKSVSLLEDLKQDDYLSKAAKDVLEELEAKPTLLNGGFSVLFLFL